MSDRHLPEFYIADDGTRVADPVYRLHADCFFGKPGGPPALWEAGTELETDLVPNEHMEPLNAAAAERIAQWRATLPIVTGKMSQENIEEAAKILQPREGEPIVPHEIWWPGVLKLAAELKAKRQGSTFIPPAYTVAPANGRPVRPMTAGDFKDVSHRGDAQTTGVKAHPQLAGKRVRRNVPPMSAEPAMPSGDAVGQE